MRKKEKSVKTSYSAYEAGPIPAARPHGIVFLDPFADEPQATPDYRRDVPSSYSLTAEDRTPGSPSHKLLQRKKALENVSRDLLALALQRRLPD